MRVWQERFFLRRAEAREPWARFQEYSIKLTQFGSMLLREA